MGLLEILGWGRDQAEPADVRASDVLRKITRTLNELEPERARYVAAFAYLLGRVAHADLSVSDRETAEMERIVEKVADLPEEQAILVVQIAKSQNTLFGGTDDFSISQEFNRLADRDQKLRLLECLFAVSSSDESISTVEDNEIRKISRELRLDHADFIAARSSYREHLGVLKPPAEEPPEG